MVSLFIRNLIFTILQPGVVAGLIPYWILGDQVGYLFNKQLLNPGLHYFGLVVFLIGLVIMIGCIMNFALKGRGTLSPLDPTQKLVISGPYKWSRNPMYVGVVLMLIGEAVFFLSFELGTYALFIFILFHVFIMLVEEPRLKRDFGEKYGRYCAQVRRWF